MAKSTSKALILLLALLILGETGASLGQLGKAHSSTNAPSHPQDTSPSMPKWMQEIKAQLKKLPNDIDTFHWTNRYKLYIENGKPVDPSGKEVQQYLDKYEKRFRDSEMHYSNNFGPGLYTASDPVSTAFYAYFDPDDWVIIKVPFKAGTSYLKANYENAYADIWKFSDEAQSELKKAGCNVAYLGLFFSDVACHGLLVKAVKALNIGFLAYPYKQYQADIESILPTYQQTAFVILSNDAVERDKVRALTSLVPEKDPDSLWRSIAEKLFSQGHELWFGLKDPWPKVKVAPKETVESYLKHFIFVEKD